MSIPKIIAHRGVRTEIPENTVSSIEAALELPGVFGVEFDVELADGPCILHQETLVLSSDGASLVAADRNFTSRDWIGEVSLKEIQDVDAGSWFDGKFEHLRIPLLGDVLSCDWKEKVAYFELKDPTYWSTRDPDRPQKIVDAIKSDIQSSSKKLEVISFNPEILLQMKHAFSQIPRVFGLWFEWEGKQKEVLTEARRIGASSITIADEMILKDPDWVRYVHDAGLAVHVYPVSPAYDEPQYNNWTAEERKSVWEKLVELKVDAIVTDFPRKLSQYFGL